MSERKVCPECGRVAETVWDRRGKDSPKSDWVYAHEPEDIGGHLGTMISYNDSCYSDDPPVVSVQ